MNNKTVNGGYAIIEELGIGGQGELYLARPTAVGENGEPVGAEVVLNRLFCFCTVDDSQKDIRLWTDFGERALALRQLEHSNIVRYRDHYPWREGGRKWPTIVMERPGGRSLQDKLKDGERFSWDSVRHILCGCIAGLIYARGMGVTPHLYVNPGNIFITEKQTVSIWDFDVMSCTKNGSSMPHESPAQDCGYMAPEIYGANGVDERSDIYSLGLCAYECLTGRRPQDVAKELGKTWGDTPEVPDYVFDLPVFWVLAPAVRAVINKAIQTDRTKRFKTLEEMRTALPIDWYRVLKGSAGDYRLMAYIDKGAFGLVFKAERVSDGSPVCVKRLLRPRHKEEDLRREANMLKACRHDHIVTYVDFIEPVGDGHQYMVMEFLEGMPEDTLKKRIDNSRPKGMNWTKVLALFGHFAEALSYLHIPRKEQRTAIMHGDIKPANLYAPKGRPEACKILDFGIACEIDVDTGAGGGQGTPGYRAPELSTNSRCTPCSDVFSLGVCFYEALTGDLPYPLDDKRQEPDMSRFCDYPTLREVVEKATARDPRQRYQTANEMRVGIRKARHELEDIESPTLRERIDNSRPKEMHRKEVLALFANFAEVLGRLHMTVPGQRRAIVHGDIKPANLYAPEGRPKECKILDVGITGDMEEGPGSGGGQETPGYRAPELDANSECTPCADVFSLGICFYEALTGELPYPLDDERQTLDMSRFLKDPALIEVVKKATARDPKQRYQTADEMLTDIRVLEKGRPWFVRTVVILAVVSVLCLAAWILLQKKPEVIVQPPPSEVIVTPPLPPSDPPEAKEILRRIQGYIMDEEKEHAQLEIERMQTQFPNYRRDEVRRMKERCDSMTPK